MTHFNQNILEKPSIWWQFGKGFFLLAFVLFGKVSLAQETPPHNPCPPFSASTEFCFENSTEYIDPCPKTVCVNYKVKASKAAQLANCVLPPGNNNCVTIGVGGTECITIYHPAGDFSDWFEITSISVTSQTSGGANVLFDSNGWIDAVENEGSFQETNEGGCDSGHFTDLQTSNGRDFVIKQKIVLGP